MKVKGIAELITMDERTIQRWIKEAADKMSSINDKMSASSPTYPADYSLEEVFVILEEHVSPAFLSLLKENVELKEKKPDQKLNGKLIDFQIEKMKLQRAAISKMNSRYKETTMAAAAILNLKPTAALTKQLELLSEDVVSPEDAGPLFEKMKETISEGKN